MKKLAILVLLACLAGCVQVNRGVPQPEWRYDAAPFSGTLQEVEVRRVHRTTVEMGEPVYNR